MKTLAITAITVLLGAALILPAMNAAQAALQVRTVEDGRYQLSPKSFGPKTSLTICEKGSCFSIDKNHKGNFGEVSKEELKAYKKAVAVYNAQKFMKNYYITGLI